MRSETCTVSAELNSKHLYHSGKELTTVTSRASLGPVPEVFRTKRSRAKDESVCPLALRAARRMGWSSHRLSHLYCSRCFDPAVSWSVEVNLS